MPMKNILIVILVLLAQTSFAQNNNIYIDISSGTSFPLGKYAGQELENGSFTQMGGNVFIRGSWLVKPPFGIGITMGGSMHPVDVQSLGWVKVTADPFLEDVSIRSDPYILFTAMGGVFYQKKINPQINIEAGFNAGAMKINSPYQLYKPQYFLYGPEYYEITSASDYSFAYQFTIDIEYEIKNDWSIMIHSSFNHSVAEYTFWTANEIRLDRKPVSFLLTNLGIRLKI